MRYYLGYCDFKWTHVDTHMEHIWVRRQVGDEIYALVESNSWQWHLDRQSTPSLPEETYCRCSIHVDVPHTPEGTHFKLKHGGNYTEVGMCQ